MIAEDYSFLRWFIVSLCVTDADYDKSHGDTNTCLSPEMYFFKFHRVYCNTSVCYIEYKEFWYEHNQSSCKR